uniref:Uncharacterized protein n=1 Tax=Leersia perrieri TaxID=77586 RepID=A0A0D9WHW6_9ORYZ
MQDSLGLMQFHDHHQYLYSNSSSSNLSLPQPFLPLEPNEHCAGDDDVPEFDVEQPAAPDLGACKEVFSDEERTAAMEEAHGVRMMALLMECAAAMSVGNLADANAAMLELSQTASPYAASCGERLVAYFADAMASRLTRSWIGLASPPPPFPPPCAAASINAAFRALHNVAPFARLAYLASNHAILDAFRGERHVHVVDLDAVPGGALQWLSLLPALAARPGGPPRSIRVTGFGAASASSSSELRDAGSQLAALARKLCVSFEFCDGGGGVRRRAGEAVAVHWHRHAMYDGDGEAMRMVRWLEPKVVTLVEPEMAASGGGEGRFIERFVSALHHYSAVFDAMGAARPDGEDASRHLAEHGVFGREIANVLAGDVGGGGGSLREELERNGFVRAGGGGGRAQMVAGACPAGVGYTVAGDHDGTVRLGWKGTPLYAVSAWTWCPSPHGRTGLI